MPAYHKVKVKVEKIDKLLDMAGDKKKKWWTKKLAVIPIVVGILGTVPKNLEIRLNELKIRGKMENHPDHSSTKICLDT